MTDIRKAVSALVAYSEANLELDPRDAELKRNALCDMLGIPPFEAEKVAPSGDVPDAVLAELVSACAENGVAIGVSEAELKDRVMGLLSLPTSAINDIFNAKLKADGSKVATDWLYGYCIANDYVKKSALDKNPRFDADGITVTINKSKPEFRDPKKAVSGNSIAGGYPKCTICRGNEGCGTVNKRNLRTVDITLNGKPWFWQYSPYGYFYQHGIAVNCAHTPMNIDENTFYNIMDFVDMFPHYFIGCNAALPRIGGSVLAHDHYQGGGEVLPMQRAGIRRRVDCRNDKVSVGILDWSAAVVRVSGKSRGDIAAVSEKIRKAWVAYDDKSLGIIAEDKDGLHNSISPTVRKNGDTYDMNIILRSNITSDRYPDGVFHAHPEYHAVKKESIGLIEAQGLFVLPGRLDGELDRICDCVLRGKLDDGLKDFASVYDETVALWRSGRYKDVHDAARAEIGSVCKCILENIAVFKTDGQTMEFLKAAGI